MVDDMKVKSDREASIILVEARSKVERMVGPAEGYARLPQLHEEVEGLKRQRAQF